MKKLLISIALILCISCKKDLSTNIVNIQFDISTGYTDVNAEYYNGVKIIKGIYHSKLSSYFKINKCDSLYFKITSSQKVKLTIFIDGSFNSIIELDSIYIKRKIFNNS